MTELHPLSVAELQQTILNPQLSPFARCLLAFMRAHSPKFKFSRRYLGKGMGVSTSPKKRASTMRLMS